MTARTTPGLLVACRAGSLERLSRRLRRSGHRVARVEAIRTEAVRVGRPSAWLRRSPPADLWIVTSRAVVDPFLREHPRWLSALARVPRVIAVGSDTRTALVSAGVRRVEPAAGSGSAAMLAKLGPVAGLRVIYLRSDRAGSELGRALRRRGARVRERVVYRLRDARVGRPVTRERLLGASLWAVSSPSALAGLRRVLGRRDFDRRIAQVRCFAMGERTARAIRRAGGRRVVAARPSTEEGLTNLLEKALNDAPRGPA